MLPNIETAAPRPPSPPSLLPPPPSVAHLLWFVAFWAVYLGVVRRLVAAEPTLLGLAIMGAYGLCVTSALFLLSVFLWRLVRGSRWPAEAGLWLGAALGMRLAVEVLLTLPERPLFGSTEAVLDAVTCLCLLGPLFCRNVPPRWKGIATVMIALYALPLMTLAVSPLRQGLLDSSTGVFLLRYVRPTALVALLAAGMWLDRRNPSARDWLHKLGLVVWIYYALMAALLRLI